MILSNTNTLRIGTNGGSLPIDVVKYYVSNSGDDSDDGLTPATAWETISKVNGETFNAGEQVLFNKGDTWLESLTVPSDSMTIGAYGSGDNPIIDGADVITGLTEYGDGVYQKTGVTTEPSIMYIDSVLGTPQASIVACTTFGDWFWDSGTDIFYVNIAKADGIDLMDGWDFESGWSVVSSATIDDSNSFTTTAQYGGISNGNVAPKDVLYELRIAGTTGSSDLRILNNNDASTVISGLSGTFDETIQVEFAFDFVPRFRDYAGAFTTDITTFTIKTIVDDTDAVIEIGQRNTLIDVGAKDNITLQDLTIQRSNAPTYGAVYGTDCSYLTISRCTIKDNNKHGVQILGNGSYIVANNNTFLRNGLTDNTGHNFAFRRSANGASHITFTNNICSYAGWNGCVFYTTGTSVQGTNAIVYGNTFEYNGGAGLYTIRHDTVAVYNNDFDSNGDENSGQETYNYGLEGCNYLDFYDNTILNTGNVQNTTTDSVQLYSDANETSHNVRVFRNHITGIGWSDALGVNMLDNLTSNNMEIFSNVITGATAGGISLYRTGAGVASTPKIYNNTFYDNDTADIRLTQDNFPFEINNNIFNSDATVNVSAGVLTSGLVSSNNLYYKASGTVASYNSSSYTTATITNLEATAQNTDPLFTDADDGDFTLQSGSPAINNGVDVGLTEDIDGNPIPSGGGYDIGAYEKQ